MSVGGPIANIVQANVQQTVLNGTLQNTDLEIRPQTVWKNGKNIKNHGIILA
jgi:hypothetical protein